MNSLVHAFFFLFFYGIIASSFSSPIVQITDGQIKGSVNNTIENGNVYYSFRGIPFAKPPVGNLRFEPPVRNDKWEGVLDATEDANFCIQGSNPVTGSEDCLYVNVYTPKLPAGPTPTLLPVMVWIYGGAYELGRCTYDDYGPDYFLDRNVVIVDFNYRVGVWGFLSTGDRVVPGNNGLKDQVLALKWIKRNIKHFGGDPRKVTIFGGSAGSASVSYMLQSPSAKGLFSQAIMESGTSLCLWALSRKAREAAFALSSELGVDTDDSQVVLDHLRTVNSSYLQTKAESIMSNLLLTTNPRDGLIFAPVTEPYNERAFMTEKSHQLLSEGRFQTVPCIIGFNSLEATFSIGLIIRTFLWKFDMNPQLLAPADMNVEDTKLQAQIGREIHQHYFGNKLISTSNVEVMKYISDDQFVRAVREFTRLISKKSKVYFYRFDYQGGLSGWTNRTTKGAAHSEEVSYMWRSKFQPTSEYDVITRNRMVSMWTNFAKFGNPTPQVEPLYENILWETADSVGGENLVCLNINKNLTLEVDPEHDDITFWDNLYRNYATPPLDTY